MENTHRHLLPAHVSARIWLGRQRARLTVRAAAERIGIGPGYLSNLERGQRCPSLVVARDIARVLLHDRPNDAQLLLEYARPDAGRSSPHRASARRRTPPGSSA